MKSKLTLVFAFSCGCTASGDPVAISTYDNTKLNIKGEGVISGQWIEFNYDTAASPHFTKYFEAERDYATVLTPEGEPNYERAIFCRVRQNLDVRAELEFILDFEGPDLVRLVPGTYALGGAGLEVKAEWHPALVPPWHDRATSGTLIVRENSFDSIHPGNEAIFEGGHFGVEFSLNFTFDDYVDGSFFVQYGTNDMNFTEICKPPADRRR